MSVDHDVQVERRDYVAPQLSESDVGDTANGGIVDTAENPFYRLS